MLKLTLILVNLLVLVSGQSRPVLTVSDRTTDNFITLRCEDGSGPVSNPVIFRNGSLFLLNGVSFAVYRDTEGIFECAAGTTGLRSQSELHIVGEKTRFVYCLNSELADRPHACA